MCYKTHVGDHCDMVQSSSVKCATVPFNIALGLEER